MGLSHLWRIWAFWLCFNLPPIGAGVELTGETHDYTALFKNLSEDFDSHKVGCPDRTGLVDAYLWRNAGYGSNINLMVLPWLDAILQGRKDIALILRQIHHFAHVKCLEASNGFEAAGGYSCIFAPMPHVCIFDAKEEWETFLKENLSTAERQYALSHATLEELLGMAPRIQQQLEGSRIDILSAKAALTKYIHSHRQGWVKRDMQLILDDPRIAALKDEPFVGIHVRRGDKIGFEAEFHEVQEYLQKAQSYIQNSAEASLSVNDIRGIWVSSDDKTVLLQAKQCFGDFFPSVDHERVVGIFDWTFKTNNTSGDNLPTASIGMEYGQYINFFVELEMLSQANVFVGTFSSNVARLIVPMREARGMLRESSLSLDRPTWWPERHLLYTG